MTSGNSQQLRARLIAQVHRVTRLGQGRNDTFLTWSPAHPATPRVCVVSFATPNLLRNGSWGAPAVEQSLNWALAHGYSYHVLSQHVLPLDVPRTWSKIWAAWLATQRRDWGCGFVMFLDADAVVHAVDTSLAPLLHTYFGNGVHLLLSTHENRSETDPDGRTSNDLSSEGGTALGCRCARAHSTCTAQDIAATTVAHGGAPNRCVINTGVFLLRNSEAGHCDARVHTSGAFRVASHDGAPHSLPQPPPPPLPPPPPSPWRKPCTTQARDAAVLARRRRRAVQAGDARGDGRAALRAPRQDALAAPRRRVAFARLQLDLPAVHLGHASCDGRGRLLRRPRWRRAPPRLPHDGNATGAAPRGFRARARGKARGAARPPLAEGRTIHVTHWKLKQK